MTDQHSQLAQLRRVTRLVADTGDVDEVARWRPEDCTTNPSLVLKAIQLPRNKNLVDRAIQEQLRVEDSNGSATLDSFVSDVADRLSVLLGVDMLNTVSGCVSTEVDARLSYDTQATIVKARRLVGLYAHSYGIDDNRVYVKIAATWEGIRAAAQLQREGIRCNMTLVFSFAQAVACGHAHAAMISPFVGRILDWYKAKEGRDFTPEEDPGVLSVRRIYQYFKAHGVRTTVMAASFRNMGEIQQLAGVDAITISPALLQELHACEDNLERMLEPNAASGECGDAKLDEFTEESFLALHQQDEMAVDKLQDGIQRFADDTIALEGLIKEACTARGIAF